jgi:hypothetical protein
MSIVVFLGPTLPVAEAKTELDAIYRPPVAHGDVLRASLGKPRAIGIIDGYFERVPAVWHKEILWAMSQGIHVFGAASMGALRAAELSSFGMEGVGEIYRAFERGELDADDEVAVAHAAAEHDYRPSSEAMVNIRATLRAAEAYGVISTDARRVLERVARSLYYPDRSYPLVLSGAAREGVPLADVEGLRAFLSTGRVNQKQLDAVEMLRVMRERFAGVTEPKRVRWHFEHTDAWEYLRAGLV